MEAEDLHHIFEAFSSLSDAQDLLDISGYGTGTAFERINHAKRHLAQLLGQDPGATARAITGAPMKCSLS